MKNYALLLPGLLCAGFAHASCGSAFCAVNTNWDIQGLSHDSGLMADLRYSYAKADEFRAGSSKKALEAPSGSDEEIEDKRTINQIVNLNLDYAISPRWGATLALPFVMRDHQHTFDSSVTGPFTQQAKFNALGDVRLLGTWKAGAGHESGGGVRFGVKLATGATDKTMSPADPADPGTPYQLERSSQPGTGSTDAIIGAYWYRNAPGHGWGWFVSGQVQTAVATKDQYRPGNETTLDLGMHYEVAQGVNLLLQLNGQHRARDTGDNANPASGGHSVSLSPGVSYALTPQTQIYGYLQKPIVRYANTDSADPASGQLMARWSAAVGITQRF